MFIVKNKTRQAMPLLVSVDGEERMRVLGFRGEEKETHSEKMTVSMRSLEKKGFISVIEEKKEEVIENKKVKAAKVEGVEEGEKNLEKFNLELEEEKVKIDEVGEKKKPEKKKQTKEQENE